MPSNTSRTRRENNKNGKRKASIDLKSVVNTRYGAGDGDRTGAAAKGRKKGNSVALFSTPVMTWHGSEPIRHKYENRSPAPRRRGLRLARDGFLFHKKTIASPCFAAPPFTQKVTLGSPVRLQARSQRLAVAANLLRQVPLPTLAPIIKGMAAPSPFRPFRHSRLRRSCHLP